jgi:hypothetical protein
MPNVFIVSLLSLGRTESIVSKNAVHRLFRAPVPQFSRKIDADLGGAANAGSGSLIHDPSGYSRYP